jgi:hypothetical protein
MQKTEVGRTSTPRIGVTLSDRRNVWVWLLHRLAVCRAGGRAVKITPRKPIEIGDIDALIAGGGDDISFQLDGTELNPNVRYDPDRDRLERDLLERAFAVGKPVLGVLPGRTNDQSGARWIVVSGSVGNNPCGAKRPPCASAQAY